MFAPTPVPEHFDRLFPKVLMVRPIQLRASAEDAALHDDAVRYGVGSSATAS